MTVTTSDTSALGTAKEVRRQSSGMTNGLVIKISIPPVELIRTYIRFREPVGGVNCTGVPPI